MLKTIKSNIVLIISFLLLLSLLLYQSYTFIQHRNWITEQNEKDAEFCRNMEYENTQYESYCKEALVNANVKVDFYTTFSNITSEGFRPLAFTLFLFIVIPSLMYICKYFKNREILNDVTRRDYRKIKSKLFKNAYKSAFILPIIIVIIFIISALYTKNFDASYALKRSTISWGANTVSNPIIFMVSYLFNIIAYSFLYINIGLCIARKYHNYFVAIILSFLVFIGIEAFLEIVFNVIFFSFILKSDLGIIFNIIDMMQFNDVFGIIPLLIFTSVMTIISFVVVHYLYKDKETLIISCEQNE